MIDVYVIQPGGMVLDSAEKPVIEVFQLTHEKILSPVTECEYSLTASEDDE